MTRYLKFVVQNGYVGRPDESDPISFEDAGLEDDDDPNAAVHMDNLTRQAEEFMYSTNYAPDYWWVECDEEGREIE